MRRECEGEEDICGRRKRVEEGEEMMLVPILFLMTKRSEVLESERHVVV